MTEETSGIDLVREQFPSPTAKSSISPKTRSPRPSIEFRINGEDAGRGFLPAPGLVTSSSRRPARVSDWTLVSNPVRSSVVSF